MREGGRRGFRWEGVGEEGGEAAAGRGWVRREERLQLGGGG